MHKTRVRIEEAWCDAKDCTELAWFHIEYLRLGGVEYRGSDVPNVIVDLCREHGDLWRSDGRGNPLGQVDLRKGFWGS